MKKIPLNSAMKQLNMSSEDIINKAKSGILPLYLSIPIAKQNL